MAWTKGQLIAEAFGELAVAGYAFDTTPEETQTAARRLEAMMGQWLARGVSVGYRFAADPTNPDPDEDSGVATAAAEPVFLHLALRIAVGYGKALPATTVAAAREGFAALLRASEEIPQQASRGMPLGAGDKYGRGPNQQRFSSPTEIEPLQIADDGGLVFGS